MIGLAQHPMSLREFRPYWKLLSPDEVKELRLNMTLKDWLKLNDEDKENLRITRQYYLDRMKPPTSSEEESISFRNHLEEASVRECSLEINACAQRLARPPLFLAFVVGLVVGIGIIGIELYRDQSPIFIWEMLFGAFVSWWIIRKRQDGMRLRFENALNCIKKPM